MHCWARYLFILMVFALGTLSLLEACGQKGPLYLPPPGDQQVPAKKADQPKSTDVPTPPTPPTPPQTPAPSPDLMAWPMGSPIENQ
jgi:predicted small lipoprotein YifL